jgi:hypothetical protein
MNFTNGQYGIYTTLNFGRGVFLVGLQVFFQFLDSFGYVWSLRGGG